MTMTLEAARQKLSALYCYRDSIDYDLERGEVFLDGEIGIREGEIDARSVRNILKAFGRKPVTIFLNSPGGDVAEGLAIYEILKSHPAKVTTRVSSLAASMASVILQAGKVRLVEPTAMVMVHRPWTGWSGDASELFKGAELLQKFENQLQDIYVERSGRSHDEVAAMLAAETWFTGIEAVEAGFADRVVGQTTGNMTLVAAKLAVAACRSGRRPCDDYAYVAALYPLRANAISRRAKSKALSALSPPPRGKL